MSEIFNLGFSPDQPTPAELEKLPTQVAILQGTAQGLQQKAVSAADQLMAEPMKLADHIVGSLIEPANDAVGSISTVRDAITAVGQQTALNAIQAPLAQAMAWGYQSQGTPLLSHQQPTSAAKRRRRGKTAATPQAAPILSPPPIDGFPAASPEPSAAPSGSAAPAAAPADAASCAVLILVNATATPELQSVMLVPFDELSSYAGPSYQVIGSYPSLAAIQAAAAAFVKAAQAINPAWGTRGNGPILAWPADAFDCAGGAAPPPVAGGGAPPPVAGGGGGMPGGAPPPVAGAPPAPGGGDCCQDIAVNVNVPPPIIPPQPPLNIAIGGPQITIVEPEPVINVTIPISQIMGSGGGGAGPEVIVIQPPVIPPPAVNIGLPPIGVSVVTPPVSVDVQCPGGSAATTAPPTSPPVAPVSPVGGLPGPCPECSIAWLALKYPQFVLASRASAKTDYDILVDAIKLGLCCASLPKQPGCSMPYLERIAPEFVLAAKAQGLLDDEVLQQAVNIGLCADELVSTGLGEGNVGQIAPGSAAELEAEFDPPTSGEASPVPTIGGAAITTTLPNASSAATANPGGNDASAPSPAFSCLAGLAAPMQTFVKAIGSFVTAECSVADGSFAKRLDDYASRQWNTQTTIGKAAATGVWWVDYAWNWLNCTLKSASARLSEATDCDADALASSFVAQVMVGLVDKWIVNVPESVAGPLQQVINSACPYHQITSAEADALRARGFIDAADWECIVKANGDQVSQHGQLLQAAWSSPSDTDLLTRKRWIEAALSSGVVGGLPLDPESVGKLTDELTYIETLFVANGWGDPERLGEWINTQIWAPSPSDAIQWMLKDVDDPQVRDTFLLDAEFTQKYGKSVKAAFDQNAVSQGEALNIWRAHWRNIAPHQLYEMHKRLRPGWTKLMNNGDVNSFVAAICPAMPQGFPGPSGDTRPTSNGFKVPTYCEELTDATQRRAFLESLVTTGYHVAEALGQDDYPAFWRQRLVALSYNVLTRVDARRAYETGVFSDAQLTAALLDRGYKESDAEALTKFYRKSLVIKFANNPTAKQWIGLPYQIQLLQQNLVADGMRVDLWSDVYAILQIKLQVSQLLKQLKQAKRNVVGGRLTSAAALKQVKAILQQANQ